MRIWGHPVHPILVHFPVAFWTVAALAHVAAAAGLGSGAIEIAKLANVAGLVMALPAMAAGFLELRTIDERGQAMNVATWHMMIMAAAWFCFLVALLLSTSSQTIIDRGTAQIVTAASAGLGFVLMSVGGWLGGRLVYEFGIGARKKEGS
jgi:uncharacterized membrane protein